MTNKPNNPKITKQAAYRNKDLLATSALDTLTTAYSGSTKLFLRAVQECARILTKSEQESFLKQDNFSVVTVINFRHNGKR